MLMADCCCGCDSAWKAVVGRSGHNPAPAENSFEGGDWQASEDQPKTVNLEMVGAM